MKVCLVGSSGGHLTHLYMLKPFWKDKEHLNKVFFTCKHWTNENEGYTVIRQFPKHEFIMASYEPFGKNKYIDITKVLNNL